jgi:hypothetical protein
MVAYVIIGAIIAGSHHYFTHLSMLPAIVSALLAVLLWPLLLLGINLHVHF